MPTHGPAASLNWLSTISLIIGPLATGGMLFALRYWHFDFLRGWPEPSGWWVTTIACSILALVSMATAIAGSVAQGRTSSTIVAVVVNMIAILIITVAWGSAAANKQAAKLRTGNVDKCASELKSYSLEELANSKYIGSISRDRSKFSNLAWALDQSNDYGGYYKKQLRVARRNWTTILQDRANIVEICAEWSSSRGDAEWQGWKGVVRYSTIDVVVD